MGRRLEQQYVSQNYTKRLFILSACLVRDYNVRVSLLTTRHDREKDVTIISYPLYNLKVRVCDGLA